MAGFRDRMKASASLKTDGEGPVLSREPTRPADTRLYGERLPDEMRRPRREFPVGIVVAAGLFAALALIGVAYSRFDSNSASLTRASLPDQPPPCCAAPTTLATPAPAIQAPHASAAPDSGSQREETQLLQPRIATPAPPPPAPKPLALTSPLLPAPAHVAAPLPERTVTTAAQPHEAPPTPKAPPIHQTLPPELANSPAYAQPSPGDTQQTVIINGLPYVKGQEPHVLGTLSSPTPPPPDSSSGN